jgi:NAD(P)-dependent dehydrogenase (short-subunit alcohol dehydrogenase family)
VGCGRAERQIAELQAQHKNRCDFSGVDVSSDADVSDWARRVLAKFGAPDLLINNAAIMNTPAPTWEIPQAEFDRLMAINVNGTMNVIRHFVPAMVKRRIGVIVNLSSGWGRSTSPEVGPYCCSKWAIEGLTRSLAQELPEGMAAVPLNPGIIDTDMLRQCWADDAGAYPSPNEWAERAAPFLLSLSGKDNGRPLTV